MKKSIYPILMFLFMATIVFSQSMQVTYPTYESVLVKSDSLTIQWRITGNITDNVKIRLFNREITAKIKDIVNDTVNNVEKTIFIAQNLIKSHIDSNVIIKK